MKFCILLTGKNEAMINDCFTHLTDGFECLSSSSRYDDINNHLKHFTPDAIVYCLSQENPDELRQLLMLKDTLKARHIPLVAIGTKEDCDEFNQSTLGMADQIYEKPISISTISAKLTTYLNNMNALKEERRQLEEEREEMKRQAEAEKQQRNEEKAEKMKKLTGKDIMPNSGLDSELESLMSEMGLFSSSSSSADYGSIDSPELKELLKMAESQEEKSAAQTRKRILIVDDDPLMLKAIKEQLHDDYDVATAISGKIAMKFLSTKHTDLILLDYEMPGENGPQVLEKLHSDENTKNIPVIFLTGIMERSKIETALALKPQGYLLKPVDHDKLMETIKQFI